MTRRLFLLATGLVLALVISACSSSGPATSPYAPAATPTASAGPVLIQTASANLNGIAETILTDARGMTLYYYILDTPQTPACTGTCLATWTPLVFNGTGKPTAAPSATSPLSVQKTVNGNQVAYGGYFLYIFKGDTAPGQTNGQGMENEQWQVATPGLGQNGYGY